MNYEDLLLEKKDGIATITLNAPDKLNALTAKMQKSLLLAVDEVIKDDEVKVVIVTGAGRAFCAGGDIGRMKARLEGTIKQSRYEQLQLVGHWVDAFLRMGKPAIAAINGACVGAGFALAMGCDIRIASEEARLGSVFINMALVPDCGITYFLPRLKSCDQLLKNLKQ